MLFYSLAAMILFYTNDYMSILKYYVNLATGLARAVVQSSNVLLAEMCIYGGIEILLLLFPIFSITTNNKSLYAFYVCIYIYI